MIKITIVNNTKKLSLNFLTDFTYKEKYEAKYGNWATEDQITRMKIAEENNEYILLGYEGFSQQQAWSDIRNKRINKHGDFRVSGFSEPLKLNLITEPYIFCNKFKGSYLYDYLISCFTNEFDDIIIYFDLGCEVVYQYYSFQDEDSALASFNFLATKGDNFYYIVGGKTIYEQLIPDRVYITPALLTTEPYNDKHDDNYINIQKQAVITQYLSLVETLYTIELYPVIDIFPDAFIEDIEININGETIKIKGRYDRIRINEDHTIEFYDKENGFWENMDISYYEGNLPENLIIGMNDIQIKTDLQRGEYTCKIHALTAGKF